MEIESINIREMYDNIRKCVALCQLLLAIDFYQLSHVKNIQFSYIKYIVKYNHVN